MLLVDASRLLLSDGRRRLQNGLQNSNALQSGSATTVAATKLAATHESKDSASYLLGALNTTFSDSNSQTSLKTSGLGLEGG